LQEELQSLNKQRILPEIKPVTSIQEVLQKIKGQVKSLSFFFYLLFLTILRRRGKLNDLF